MAIQIAVLSPVSHDEVQPLYEALSAYDADVIVENKPEPDPQNILEWALPAIIAILAMAPVKAFIEGFFEEAGGDAFRKLKGAFVNTYRIGSEKKRFMSVYKQPDETRYHPPISFKLHVGGNPVSFVFPFGLSDDDIDNAMNELRHNLPKMQIIVNWQVNQIGLISQNYESLFGETFDITNHAIYMHESLASFVLGTWVYVKEAKAWVKAH